ncbi:MAG: hypothetical protein LBU25_08080, partial [Treponema sp.]|nr:hypothetical protein [Treponema sp.]
MKQDESRVRYFHRGFILGLAAVLVGLGACSGALLDPQESIEEQEAKAQITPDAEGRVLVKVGLGTGSSGRSVLPSLVELHVNSYEVVFKD